MHTSQRWGTRASARNVPLGRLTAATADAALCSCWNVSPAAPYEVLERAHLRPAVEVLVGRCCTPPGHTCSRSHTRQQPAPCAPLSAPAAPQVPAAALAARCSWCLALSAPAGSPWLQPQRRDPPLCCHWSAPPAGTSSTTRAGPKVVTDNTERHSTVELILSHWRTLVAAGCVLMHAEESSVAQACLRPSWRGSGGSQQPAAAVPAAVTCDPLTPHQQQ